MFDTLADAFAAERAAGCTIGSHQPPQSAARLDAAVRAAVQAYVAAGHQDWRALAKFNDSHYVRHLVDENGDFEMILICWKQGQASRVHNHAQSHCWLNVLSGGVEELRYTTGDTPEGVEPAVAPRLPGVISASAPCPLLMPAGVGKVGPGGTAYINDTIALHAVRCDDAACEAAGEEGAVSLHVYAPPIRRVKLYEQEENRVTVRAPGFATIRGVVDADLQDLSRLSSSL
ncbi:cysteine dioxygenase [Chlorella sorokiniana]|uniref:Cysteine dioxygenase n=1 Tax=Chlorella sorokiniana TaxID=3076 RepID=A0A2P6TS58_CHLSO|nr:cysteine dioxygenase [Chlorella sorokiniana]|eukprot:PRW56884.1 cysteine dioxygenase [Chlorella sorokiniana]